MVRASTHRPRRRAFSELPHCTSSAVAPPGRSEPGDSPKGRGCPGPEGQSPSRPQAAANRTRLVPQWPQE
eukprot:13762401-Alexandrium_andersonii.AAC.1